MSAAAKTRPKTTYDELIADTTPWSMAAIAANLDVKMQTVRMWRRDALAAARTAEAGRTRRGRAAAAVPHPSHLPTPDIPLDGKPAWKAGTIRKWAIQTGRMTADGVPQRAKPPGRPRAQK